LDVYSEINAKSPFAGTRITESASGFVSAVLRPDLLCWRFRTFTYHSNENIPTTEHIRIDA
jgi:hypothetical protein